MSPAIYDIAGIVSVSKSTISRVLNKQTNISPEAHEKVLQAAEESQYQPNKLTHALTSSSFDAIMVISTRSTKTTAGNPFFSEVLCAVATKTEKGDFDMILQTSHNPAEDLQKCESKIERKMIKDIIMPNSPTDESFFTQPDKYDIPVMVIGKVEGQCAHVYSAGTDNFGDSIALTNALIESGHRNVACLHAPLDVRVSVGRVNGYRQSLAAHNITARDEWIVDDGYTHGAALRTARESLSQSPLPGAAFATGSLKLMNIYRATAEKNIAIPQQLAVVDYSNETLSLILTPAPGGTDIPTQGLGQQSYELLFRLISGKPSLRSITVATHMTLK